MKPVVALGADHAGYTMKVELSAWLEEHGFEVNDVGAHYFDGSDDYPDFAQAVARAVASKQSWRGIVICGSGVGACIVANKVPGGRASVCHDTYSARQGVQHDDMNILCLGARIVGLSLTKELVTAFLDARFVPEERHLRRLKKLEELEQGSLNTGQRPQVLKGKKT